MHHTKMQRKNSPSITRQRLSAARQSEQPLRRFGDKNFCDQAAIAGRCALVLKDTHVAGKAAAEIPSGDVR
jgi:hypothetical protein